MTISHYIAISEFIDLSYPSIRPAIDLSVCLSVCLSVVRLSLRLSVCLGPQRYCVEVCMTTTITTIVTHDTLNARQIRLQGCSLRARISRMVWERNWIILGIQHKLIDCQQAHPRSWIFNVWVSDTAKIVVWLPSLSPTIGEITAGSLSLRLSSESALMRSERKSIVEGRYIHETWLNLIENSCFNALSLDMKH